MLSKLSILKKILLAIFLEVAFLVSCSEAPLKAKTDDPATQDTARSLPPLPKDPLWEGRTIGIGFYNCENLFDTLKAQGKSDDEFLPKSPKRYNTNAYQRKVQHTAEAIAAIQQALQNDSLIFVGLVEVENQAVVEDLLKTPALSPLHFRIIHRESSDPRGIDAALLYNPWWFTPQHIELIQPFDGAREVLHVVGELRHTPTHIFVNHWTSRANGGASKRLAYAQNLNDIIEQIKRKTPQEQVILMGDLNDNPSDPNIRNTLMAEADPTPNTRSLYNPFATFYDRGFGTAFYGSAWDLFDQMMVLVSKTATTTIPQVTEARILRASFLLDENSHPKRFYDRNTLVGGYSDHLPIFVKLK